MTNIPTNLRKAAVLLRSLDGDTAAMMLAQLSPEEAAAIRDAMRRVGPLDPDEQANVAAELRRVSPPKSALTHGDVELSLSSAFDNNRLGESYSDQSAAAPSKRFEFLESAPTNSLVPYLAREHAQTVAVVLSHLAPQRAASLLAALPQQLQADTIERLTTIGETDPESVSVLERELEAWVAQRGGRRGGARRDTMASIIAAADAKSRSSILSNMKNHNGALARQLAPKQPARPQLTPKPLASEYRKGSANKSSAIGPAAKRAHPVDRPEVPRAPRVAFDDLIHLDSRALATVLRQVDANVLALALAGSRDEMVDRICEQMPKRTARAFRRELRRLGPTRLSDVESAQRAVARIAERQLAERQHALSGAGF